jgi:hypothetical protein
MPVTVTFDKAVYRIGEPAEITFDGLTAGTTYHVKLKNTTSGAERALFNFSAPGTSFTVKTYVQAFWKDFDKIVVDGDQSTLPSILSEVHTAPLRMATDQLRYKRGEAVSISLSNLITGNTYRLKITSDSGEILISEFTPTSSSETKLWSVPANFPLGVHVIKLYQVLSPSELLLTETAIEIFEPAPTPPTPPATQPVQQFMEFLQRYWWVIIIIFIILVLLIRR